MGVGGRCPAGFAFVVAVHSVPCVATAAVVVGHFYGRIDGGRIDGTRPALFVRVVVV